MTRFDAEEEAEDDVPLLPLNESSVEESRSSRKAIACNWFKEQSKWEPSEREKFFILIGLFVAAIRIIIAFELIPYYQNQLTGSIENQYLNVLEISNFAANWSKEFTKAPHMAGQNYELVEWQAEKFEEFGLKNVQVDDYDVHLNYPIYMGIRLLENDKIVYEPSLKEDELEKDPGTVGEDLIPAFHGYSASGNVSAKYVYANYGRIEDFQTLLKNGIDPTGKVVIVRYGVIARSSKAQFSQEYGACGVLMYSEPADDDYLDENSISYPDGPGRQPSSIERGSVAFDSQPPGDPTTPGWASKGEDIPRIDPHSSIPKIPSMPISYKEIIPILQKMNGHGVKIEGWEGILPDVEYFTGPNPMTELNLRNYQDYKIRKIFNVYGEIPGKISNEIIIVGNHRDAWIKGGAGDPNSGSATILEIVRALNELTKTGWKPLRTVRFASWDGEEYNLIGSTEYGELNHKKLMENVVAYLNLDVAVSGKQLICGGSPLMHDIIYEYLSKVKHGVFTNQTLLDNFESLKGNKIQMIGGGSDFTVFLEHLGIPALDLSFVPGVGDPVYHYHSNYDSYYWMSTFGDPGFVLHNTMAKLYGLFVLDFANSDYLKLDLKTNSEVIKNYFDLSVEKLEKFNNTEIKWNNYIDENNLLIFKFEEKSSENPEYREFIEFFRVSILHSYDTKKLKTIEELIKEISSSIDHFINVSIILQHQSLDIFQELEELESKNPWNPITRLKIERLRRKLFKLNEKARFLERYFLYYEGLNNRSWFRHIIYATGRYTGYDAQSFPGLSEAVEDDDPEDVVKWLLIIDSCIKKATKWLNK